MRRGLYLRLGLLGGRRCGGGCCCNCCWVWPLAITADPLLPVLLSWWCCLAALLLEREATCERECWLCPWLGLWLWPSDEEGFDVPGLLWDFSIVVTCVSKTTRFTKLPKTLFFTWQNWRGCDLLNGTCGGPVNLWTFLLNLRLRWCYFANVGRHSKPSTAMLLSVPQER